MRDLDTLGGDPRFLDAVWRCAELHAAKQQDYGQRNDPFANVRGAEEWGVRPWVGALIRATDKVRRLQSAAKGSRLRNESAEDSFMDLAVYALIGLILYQEDEKSGLNAKRLLASSSTYSAGGADGLIRND